MGRRKSDSDGDPSLHIQFSLMTEKSKAMLIGSFDLVFSSDYQDDRAVVAFSGDVSGVLHTEALNDLVDNGNIVINGNVVRSEYLVSFLSARMRRKLGLRGYLESIKRFFGTIHLK